MVSGIRPMRILVSNDDGVHAEGIRALSEALTACGEVIVVAPDRNRSGASHSLTLEVPLRVTRLGETGFNGSESYAVKGTPTDCVHLAVTGMFDHLPDMVVSGVNHGANMGDDTVYSGTVAAATEGFFLGVPSIAVSLVSKSAADFTAAARVARDLAERFMREPFPQPVLLNVNVPDVAYDRLQGVKVTRLGKRHKAEPVVRSVTPRNETVYWIGAAGAAADAGEGTDFHAVANGYVSVTPLQLDLTHTGQLSPVFDWLRR